MTFDQRSRQRISSAVQKVERFNRNPTPARKKNWPTPTDAAPRMLIGVTNEEIAFGSSGSITIYESSGPGQPPQPVQPTRIETAWYDWIQGDDSEPIPPNTDVAIAIAEHGQYRIYHAACSARPGR